MDKEKSLDSFPAYHSEKIITNATVANVSSTSLTNSVTDDASTHVMSIIIFVSVYFYLQTIS